MAELNVVINDPGSGTREQDLIAQVQRGHHELFYELVRPYERRVYAAAMAILRNQTDAEDVAQEAMLKALANIRQFRAEARFSTWLIQITVNEALMRRRRERAGMIEGIDDHRDDEGEYTPRDFADWREIPSEALLREETRRLVQESIAELPANYREVLTLRDVNGKNIAETSEILGITIGNTKARLLRARLMLRDIFVERTQRKPAQQPSRGVAP